MTRTDGYVARYRRDEEDGAWLVDVIGIDGCQTYGRSLREARRRILEALAAWTDTEPGALRLDHRLPGDVASLADEVRHSREEAEVARARAAEVMARAVARLGAMGVSRRDAAELLGVSHQRIQQLSGPV